MKALLLILLLALSIQSQEKNYIVTKYKGKICVHNIDCPNAKKAKTGKTVSETELKKIDSNMLYFPKCCNLNEVSKVSKVDSLFNSLKGVK
jgi:hypothetical protein